MRYAIEEIIRALSEAVSHERGARQHRIPRRLRPHVARSTFTPTREPKVTKALMA